MGNKVFEIAKWGIIVLMGVAIIILLRGNRELRTSYEALKLDGTYVATYQSQTINELRKTNTELYDSIKRIRNVKQAAIIKYKYIYEGKTIYVPRELPQIKDSVYTYIKKSDTLSYKLSIKADSVQWHKLDFTLNEKLTIINREENGQNETTISTATSGGTITGTQMFNKTTNQNSFLNRISFSVQAGAGYGLINRKPDIYVGIGVSFRLNKIK